MSFLLHAGLGVCVLSVLIHGAIGLRAPVARRSVSFALSMVFLSLFLVGQTRSLHAQTVEELVAVERWQFCFSAGLVGSLAWFSREYTGVRVPRPLALLFYGLLLLSVAANLIAPWGGFLGSRPRLSTAVFAGERLTSYSAALGPLQAAWLGFCFLFIVGAIAMGVQLVRRGDRRRGTVFITAFALMLLVPIVDVLQDPARPRIGAVGVLSLALIMSIELAVEFRAKEAALSKAFHELQEKNQEISAMLESSLALRDQLNSPLQTMALDLTLLSRKQSRPALERMQRALARLTELGRRLQGQRIA